MGSQSKKQTSRSARARKRRLLPLTGHLALAVVVVIAAATIARQMTLRSRSLHAPRRQSARQVARPMPSPGGPLPTPVSALPRQQAQSDLPEADARARLRREADSILQAIESGSAFGKRTNTIVEAHFAIGTNTWRVRDAAAPNVAPQFEVASPTPPAGRGAGGGKVAAGEGWRFIAFRGPEGERLEPLFVLFPNGTVQGGMVEMGWDDLRAVIGLDASGHATVECPGAFPMAAPTLPPPGAGVEAP